MTAAEYLAEREADRAHVEGHPCPYCAQPLIGATLATALHPQPLWCAWDGARVPAEANGREDCEDCGGSESDPCHACATAGERREGLNSASIAAQIWMHS